MGAGDPLDGLQQSGDANRLFHSNEITMEIDDYHLRLEDDMHQFRADTLFVSTISNSLGVRNIQISPITSTGEKLRNQINIQCKMIDIDQVNLKVCIIPADFQRVQFVLQNQ